MKTLNILFAIAIGGALSASGLLDLRAQAKFRANAKILRQQSRQQDALKTENERLTDLIAQAKTNRPPDDDQSSELAQLRAKAAVLKQQTNELAQLASQMAAERRLAGVKLYTGGDSNLLAHNHELGITFRGGPRETGKLNDARALTAALQKFAQEHQGAFPSSLDQVTAYLPAALNADSPGWDNAPLSGTNSFEVMFQGTMADLADIPPRRVALIRELQPWQTPEGYWARAYGYADGAASIVESDDNFQTWDAQHVIPPPDGL